MSTSYTHTQSVPSDTWTVQHDLNGPVVTDAIIALNSQNEKVLPMDVVLTSLDVLTVTFSEPVAGTIQVVGTHRLTRPGARVGTIGPGML